MKDIMIDLETLGTGPGCSILSIGAVAFDEFGVADEGFYAVVSRESCKEAGLQEDDSTLEWWDRQSEAARRVLHESETKGKALTLAAALGAFAGYMAQFPGDVRVWGNGGYFDLGILGVAYRLGVPARNGKPDVPWMWGDRCYRTIKNQYKDVKMQRTGTYHNALDDARSQAAHLVQICQTRGLRLG